MKYESNILERLIKTYGVVGNPKYVSEIIKQFIIQGKECYPNLFTYQADWLAHVDEFGLTPEYTVSYTGQSIYAPNTLERPVKSAILTGNTLVNLATQKSGNFNGKRFLRIPLSYTLKTNTKYFVKFNLRDSSLTDRVMCRFKNSTSGSTMGALKSEGIVTVTGNGYNTLEFYITNANGLDAVVDDIMVIEYRDSMENWDIPYFDSIQSVKMPVLTTSNEDGTKTNILTVNEDVTLRSNGNICDELNLLTGQLTQRIDEDGEVLSQEVVKTVELTILDQNGQSVEYLKSFNGGTHVHTSCLEGSLVPAVVISVVTNLEETLKVCSLDGNTL